METGYENILLVRLLLEIKVPHVRKSSVCREELERCRVLDIVLSAVHIIYIRRISLSQGWNLA